MTGIELINIERQRQIDVEGYTIENDKKYTGTELFAAALCYYNAHVLYRYVDVPETWPFPAEYWKPTPENRIKELTKAGALFKADYDVSKDREPYAMMNVCAAKIQNMLNDES